MKKTNLLKRYSKNPSGLTAAIERMRSRSLDRAGLQSTATIHGVPGPMIEELVAAAGVKKTPKKSPLRSVVLQADGYRAEDDDDTDDTDTPDEDKPAPKKKTKKNDAATKKKKKSKVKAPIDDEDEGEDEGEDEDEDEDEDEGEDEDADEANAKALAKAGRIMYGTVGPATVASASPKKRAAAVSAMGAADSFLRTFARAAKQAGRKAGVR